MVKTLASASRDKTIKLWTLDGHALKTLKGHSARVMGVSFSTDSKTLASASDDGSIRLWSVGEGRELQTIQGGGYPFGDISFSSRTVKPLFLSVMIPRLKSGMPKSIEVEQLIDRSCNWLQDYLKHNVRLDPADRQICDDI